jgi:hypothetical protein
METSDLINSSNLRETKTKKPRKKADIAGYNMVCVTCLTFKSRLKRDFLTETSYEKLFHSSHHSDSIFIMPEG